MSHHFTRNIINVKDILEQKLYTNNQNDLLSDDEEVYVRNVNWYEPITGAVRSINNILPDRVNGDKSGNFDLIYQYVEEGLVYFEGDTIILESTKIDDFPLLLVFYEDAISADNTAILDLKNANSEYIIANAGMSKDSANMILTQMKLTLLNNVLTIKSNILKNWNGSIDESDENNTTSNVGLITDTDMTLNENITIRKVIGLRDLTYDKPTHKFSIRRFLDGVEQENLLDWEYEEGYVVGKTIYEYQSFTDVTGVFDRYEITGTTEYTVTPVIDSEDGEIFITNITIQNQDVDQCEYYVSESKKKTKKGNKK